MASIDRERLTGLARRGGWAVREALWPRRCAGCGVRGVWLCDGCGAALPPFDGLRCLRCGIPANRGECRCAELPGWVEAHRAIGPHAGWIQSAVHLLKYGDEPARAVFLGRFMAAAARDLPRPDLIVPVPLHGRRLRARGYNQSALLAESISVSIGRPVGHVLVRTVDTPHQVGLDSNERQRNVRGAFAVTDAGMVTGCRVWLIDDVLTTGATAGEAAYTLISAGAESVVIVTAARA